MRSPGGLSLLRRVNAAILPVGDHETARVRAILDAIAPRCDLVNRLATFGLDRHAPPADRACAKPNLHVVALDFACEAAGRERLRWTSASSRLASSRYGFRWPLPSRVCRASPHRGARRQGQSVGAVSARYGAVPRCRTPAHRRRLGCTNAALAMHSRFAFNQGLARRHEVTGAWIDHVPT